MGRSRGRYKGKFRRGSLAERLNFFRNNFAVGRTVASQRRRTRMSSSAVASSAVDFLSASSSPEEAGQEVDEQLSSESEVDGESGESVIAGRRIVDISLLVERCRRGCCSCKTVLNLVDIVSEQRSGLASIFRVKCSSCRTENLVQTSKSVVSKNGKRRVFSVNTKAALVQERR
eukprot:scpid98556/ scgid27918/ 